MHIKSENRGGYSIWLTMVYGANETSKRKQLWDRLTKLRQQMMNEEWLLASNFNEIGMPSDRDEHGPFDQEGANNFNVAVQGLTKLISMGGFYTWTNRIGQRHTRNRLDCIFGRGDWINY